MQWAILKIKEGLVYLSLGLINHLKGYSQTLYHENVPLNLKNVEEMCASHNIGPEPEPPGVDSGAALLGPQVCFGTCPHFYSRYNTKTT
jgi:hypothetical protein